MSQSEDDLPLKAPKWLLGMGETIYSKVVEQRARAFDEGRKEVRELPAKVISVGNITAGGSGKTPMTQLLGKKLLNMGKRFAIVSRGYGRKSKGQKIVSCGDAKGPMIDALQAGDEPWMLARQLPDAIVIVDADRYQGGLRAIKELGAEVILLDDGFQHRKLHRDLDIVMLDAQRPLANGHLLPRGYLREGPEALHRAKVLVYNHGAQVAELSREPQEYEVGKTILEVSVQPEEMVHGAGKYQLPLDKLPESPMGVLTGIARPERFFKTLEKLGVDIRHHQFYPDHHCFTEAEYMDFASETQKNGTRVQVTTEKDLGRIPEKFRDRLLFLRISLAIHRGEDQLDKLLKEVLG